MKDHLRMFKEFWVVLIVKKKFQKGLTETRNSRVSRTVMGAVSKYTEQKESCETRIPTSGRGEDKHTCHDRAHSLPFSALALSLSL